MLHKLKIGFLLLSMLFLRPFLLGEEYTTLGLIILSIASFLHFIELKLEKRDLSITLSNIKILTLYQILWLYLFLHSIIQNKYHPDFVTKAFLTHIFTFIIMCFILSDEKSNKNFFKSMILLFAGTGVSYILTYLLGLLLGIDKLLLFQFTVSTYNVPKEVYFPFTVIYGYITLDFIDLPRLTGFLREPGIFQSFLIWGIFSAKYFNLNNKYIKFALLLSLIFTFSTAGIALLLFTLFTKFIIDKKYTFGVISFLSTLIIGLYAPVIGIANKLKTHGASISDRTNSMVNGLNSFLENPFGVGLYNTDIKHAGINLISSLHLIGIFGFILILLVYLSPLISSIPRKDYIIVYLPIILTSMFSQPLIDAPVIYVLLLAKYRTINILNIPKNLINRKENIPIKKINYNVSSDNSTHEHQSRFLKISC